MWLHDRPTHRSRSETMPHVMIKPASGQVGALIGFWSPEFPNGFCEAVRKTLQHVMIERAAGQVGALIIFGSTEFLNGFCVRFAEYDGEAPMTTRSEAALRWRGLNGGVLEVAVPGGRSGLRAGDGRCRTSRGGRRA